MKAEARVAAMGEEQSGGMLWADRMDRVYGQTSEPKEKKVWGLVRRCMVMPFTEMSNGEGLDLEGC